MSAFLDWLLESGWQAAVMAAVIFAILTIGARRIPASWRYGLLLLIVARLLLPALPQSPVSAYRVVPASPREAWSQAWPEAAVPPLLEPRIVYHSPAASAARVTGERAINWRIVVFWIWAAGSVTAVLGLTLRQAIFHRRFKRQRTAPSDELAALLNGAAREAGLRHAPRLWFLEGIGGPALMGLWRPVLMLPRDIELQLDRESLRLVFLHECMHVKRVDPWTHTASLAAWTLHWWNPISWWLIHRLRVERELATDAAVLEKLNQAERRAYGETLLGLTQEDGMLGGIMSPALGILERHGDLKRRIAQIGAFVRTRLVWSFVGAALVVGTASLLLAKQAQSVLEPLPTDVQAREELTQDFIEAVRSGDIRKVGAFLDRGLDINAARFYFVPLLEATSNGNPEMVRYLLARGALVEPPSGQKPLERACLMGNRGIADILIAAGAKIDPLYYESGIGDLAALQKSVGEKLLTARQLKETLRFAVTSNHQDVFDWLWARQGEASPQRESLLASCYQEAASWGHLALMKRIETLGVDLKKVGLEALDNAVIFNHPAEVEHLLKLGVPPGPGTRSSGSLLKRAAGEGRLEIVKALVNHGAALDDCDSSGTTALSYAAFRRQEAVCAFLIDRGADLEIKDSQGCTALWRAAFGGDAPDTVKKLLDKGAKVDGVDKQGEGILAAMQQFSSPFIGEIGYPGKRYDEKSILEQRARTRKVAALLIDAGADTRAVGYGGTPLMVALDLDHPEIAEVLIEKGADIHQKDKAGNTAISMAFGDSWTWLRGIDYHSIKLLLDKGADPNATYTPAHAGPSVAPVPILNRAFIRAAINHAHPDRLREVRETVALLLESGARFQGASDARVHEWLAASAKGDLAALKELRESGVDINAADQAGWTALTISLALDQQAVTQWLIANGINLTAGAKNYPPLYFAVEDQDISLVRKLLAAGARPDTASMTAAANKDNLELFKMLVTASGDASKVEVFIPIRFGNAEMLKTMLEKGANADSRENAESRTAVYWAVFYDHAECLKRLLEYGADPDVRDVYGETPLDQAKRSRPAMVPILEEAIARWKAKYPSTFTAPGTYPLRGVGKLVISKDEKDGAVHYSIEYTGGGSSGATVDYGSRLDGQFLMFWDSDNRTLWWGTDQNIGYVSVKIHSQHDHSAESGTRARRGTSSGTDSFPPRPAAFLNGLKQMFGAA